ncbi:MAG: LysM peptidoglycan-binding domain-containing protein [Treponema sp.]|nr:LysM peptidoglycan-binding domain-containing protein [Treponema sp.]
MAGTIGIKVANGDFYPIVDENSPVAKRLVLTTVHDNQDNVQINLFRSISKSMLDAQYIGSLVVEDIRPCLKGEPSIQMLISADNDGNITAEAHDLEASPDSDHHILNVSLRTMDTFTRPEDYSDFDLDTEDSEPKAAFGSFERERHTEEKSRKFPWALMLVIILLIAIGLGALWFFFIRDNDGAQVADAGPDTEQVYTPAPPVAVEPPPPPPPAPVQPPPVPETVAMPTTPETPPVEISPPVIQAPVTPPVIQAPAAPPPVQAQVQRDRPPAPVMSHRVPAVIPPQGVVYQIRWGDTLWDIAAAFYRDPFQYPRIARHNNIRDPNLILAGFSIRIPPLN